jgi:hypothetical protein
LNRCKPTLYCFVLTKDRFRAYNGSLRAQIALLQAQNASLQRRVLAVQAKKDAMRARVMAAMQEQPE